MRTTIRLEKLIGGTSSADALEISRPHGVGRLPNEITIKLLSKRIGPRGIRVALEELEAALSLFHRDDSQVEPTTDQDTSKDDDKEVKDP